MTSFLLAIALSGIHTSHVPAFTESVSIGMTICGKRLELGMSAKLALEPFTKGGDCDLYNTDSADLFAVHSLSSDVVVGTIEFTHGLVSELHREWITSMPSTNLVIDALQEMEKQGAVNCILKANNTLSPDLNSRTAILSCGKRSLVFGTANHNGKSEEHIEEIVSNK